MNRFFVFALVLLASISISACGGGGGGGIGNAPALFSLNGGWAGEYDLPTQVVTITGTIVANGNSFTGTFATSLGATLNLSGQVSGNQIVFSISSTAPGPCNGSFSGTGMLVMNAGIDGVDFTFSGSDCNGSLSNVFGFIDRTSGPLLAAAGAPMIAQVGVIDEIDPSRRESFVIEHVDASALPIDGSVELLMLDVKTGRHVARRVRRGDDGEVVDIGSPGLRIFPIR